MADSLILAAMDLVDAAADAHGVDYLTAAKQLCAQSPYTGLDAVKLAEATRLKFCPSAKRARTLVEERRRAKMALAAP